MYDAQAPHELRGEVPLLGRERGAPGERDPLGAVDGVSVRVLRNEAVIAGRLDVLCQFVEHEVPVLVFPLAAARRAVLRLFDSAGGRCELDALSAPWAPTLLVHPGGGLSPASAELGLVADVRSL